MKKRSFIQKTFIFTILFVYSFALLKPIFPVVNDILAHAFFSSNHMSTVHFENGEYHLHVELILEASQQKENPKENIPASVYETLANHTLSESKFNLPDCVISDLKFPPFQQHLSDVCLPITSPPPEA